MSDDLGETRLLLSCKDFKERERVLADLFTGHRDRLRRLVVLRLDRRLQKRLDPSDVLQEVYIEASRRLKNYLEKPAVPVFIWLRFLTGQKIQDLHRRHLAAKARDARKEISLDDVVYPEASSAALAASLIASDSASAQSSLEEKAIQLARVLNRLDPVDREILALRQFERLTAAEAGKVLGMNANTLRARYFRALKRLQEELGQGRQADGKTS